MIAYCPIAAGPAKEFVPILFISPLQVLNGRNKFSLSPSLPQDKQPNSAFPNRRGVPSLQSFLWPLLDLLYQVNGLCVLRAPELDAALQMWFQEGGAEGQNHLLHSS